MVTGVHFCVSTYADASASTWSTGCGARSQLSSTLAISARASSRRANCQWLSSTHAMAKTTATAR